MTDERTSGLVDRMLWAAKALASQYRVDGQLALELVKLFVSTRTAIGDDADQLAAEVWEWCRIEGPNYETTSVKEIPCQGGMTIRTVRRLAA